MAALHKSHTLSLWAHNRDVCISHRRSAGPAASPARRARCPPPPPIHSIDYTTEIRGYCTYLSGTSGLCQHGAFSHFFRLFSTFGVLHQNVVTLGGVCVCFSKSVGKRRFRNVWVGGGRWSQFCAQSCTREDTQGTGNGPGITHYSESDSLSARAGTPLGHTSPCL